MSRGVDLIAAERARQKLAKEAGGEGYTAQHDANHSDDIARAAAAYALPVEAREWVVDLGVRPRLLLLGQLWPWAGRHWKPTPGDRVRELQKAGALIAAAIDSLLARGDQP